MAKQFTPPPGGNHNTISFSGRTYSSTGGAVTAPDFDASILEANGWQIAAGGSLANTVPPGISGAANVGQTLTASTGSWSSTPASFTYQWKRDGVNIAGATVGTYVVQGADVGHLITVVVTAIPSPPTFESAGVSIVGPPTLQALSFSANSFTAGAAQGTVIGNILGATAGSTVTILTQSTAGALQIGAGNVLQVGPTPPASPGTITLTLRETLAGATNTPRDTAGLSVIESAAGGVPVNTALPTINDTTPTEGQLLTATNGAWTNTPTGFTYVWLRGAAAIAGATAITYTPVAADVGNTLSVRVTASNGSGAGAPATSAATSAVAAAGGAVPVNTALPAVTGTATVGQTLSVSNGTWTNTPTGFAYQWKRAGVNITGATANTYPLVVLDQGKAITCAVTASNGSGSSAPATSNATSAVISELAAITVPTTNLMAVYSMVKTNSYAGNAIRVRRASDNTEQDIGFAGNVVDWGAADTFATGSDLFITTWYDQSGNARDLTQTVTAEQPQFNRHSHRRGVRPLTQPFASGGGTGAMIRNTAGFNFNCNSFTAYLLHSPRNTYETANYLDITSAAGATERVAFYHQGAVTLDITLAGALAADQELTAVDIASFEPIVISSGVTAFVEVNGIDTAVPAASGLQVVDGVRLGDSTVAAFDNCSDYFIFAVYDAAHDAATVDTNRAAFVNSFVAPPAVTNRVVYAGSSLVTSQGQTKARTLPYQAGFGRLSVDDDPAVFTFPAIQDWDIISMGEGGRRLETEAGLTAAHNAAYNAARTKNVFVMDAPSNDFVDDPGSFDGPYADAAAAEAAADSIYNTITLPFVTGLQGIGYTVVVPTCIPRTGFDSTTDFMDTARLRYNTNVRNGAVANNYTVSDRCSVAPFDSIGPGPFDQTYYAIDNIHCRDAGYVLLAQIDRAAILAAGA
ncbi:MAG: hypothetical protein L0Y60_16760 [Beijerinckiaceae bacterium]|nr:hypothetical protein [Beijerinckiaceae bacterium]